MKNKLLQLKLKFFISSFFISIALLFYNIIYSTLILKFVHVKLGNQNKFDNSISNFILVVFIAPFIETILFQFLLIYQVYESYKTLKTKYFAVFVSTFFFALSHFYSFYYFLGSVFAGLFLALSFCHFKEKTNYFSAVIYVMLSHSLLNGYVFLIKQFNLL
jgi:hypothetical protein